LYAGLAVGQHVRSDGPVMLHSVAAPLSEHSMNLLESPMQRHTVELEPILGAIKPKSRL
jgi:hypothetical protein